MLSEHLERISADSIWAHRASGVLGLLLRLLDEASNESSPGPTVIADALQMAFRIFEGAARQS
jgi:hypothetical protein